MRRIELPRDTRTTFAENDLALFCAFPGGLPPTLGEGGDSPGQLGDSESLGMPDLSREGCRHLKQRRGAPGAGRASRGGVTRFVGDRAGDSIRFARAESEEKMPSLKIPAAQSVGHAQSLGNGPAGIDPDELLGGDLGCLPLPESEPAQPDQDPMVEKREDGACRGRGISESDLFEDAPKDRKALIDESCAYELLRGAPLELSDSAVGALWAAAI